MPKYLVGLSYSLMLVLLACSKPMDASKTDENITLLGKWTLIESLSDPGDGSGRWQPTNTPNDYIEFFADSSMKTNVYTQFSGLNKYQNLNDSTINLINGSGNVFTKRYKISNNELMLTGGCYEACGLKFKRAIF